MPLFLVPIVVGAAAGAGTAGLLTQEKAGDYSADVGGRQLDAYQIYQQLHAGDNGSSLMTGRESASTLKSNFAQRISEMDTLAKRMDEAWQGDSAEAAKAGAHPLKQWLQDSEGKLHSSDNTMASQLDAYNTVLSQVQPVPAKPPESNFLNDITPWTTDTDRAIQQYNQMAQANVEAYNAYYSVSNANGQQMPHYTVVDGEFGEVEVDGSGSDSGGGGNGGGGGTGGGGNGGTGGGGNYPGGSPGSVSPGGIPGGSYPGGNYPGGTGGGTGTGTGTAVPVGPYPGGTYPGGTNPGGVGPGGIGGPGGPGSIYTPGQWDDGTSASNFTPDKKLPIGPGGGQPNTLPGGTPPTTHLGGGGGGTPVSGGGGLGTMPGPLGPNSPGASTGAAAPGAGAGAAAAGRAAMGGAAAAGARGMGGMPMGAMGGAGARGQGSEDEEHQTKYLVEEDGDSLFGSDELTAPPVIGE
ncbi:hypothetical protein [Saccharomonospora sp. NB11]|jgi:hypothetical protein|uniref:hypothetical protein n=1 Tax=Saccharomonospora sp. NB11 TaxID=1642298 RepID=UPI0018D141C8|nr:hypothetical protein [Saccharomonospora sp. NB11]